jgi:hypothetical protein
MDGIMVQVLAIIMKVHDLNSQILLNQWSCHFQQGIRFPKWL